MTVTPRQLLLPVLTVLSSMVATATLSAAPPLQATVQADRTQAAVGQPVRVTLQIRNSEGTPEVKVPQSADFTLSPVGPRQLRPSLLAGVEALRPGGPVPGQQLAEALRGLINQLPADGLDPNLMRQLGDPNLIQEYQKALGSLADLKNDDATQVYLFQPKHAGQVTLPAFTVSAGGQTATTQPVVFDVTDAKPAGPVQARLSLSNRTPLPGEEVQLYADLLLRRGTVGYGPKVYPHQPVKAVTLTLPTPDGGSGLEMAKPLVEVLRDNAVKPGQKGFHVSGFQGEVMLEHEAPGTKGDPQWYRRRLTIPLRVRQGGTFTVPPLSVVGEVFVTGTGGKSRWEPFAVTSEPLTINARDLANKPKDFSGAVGTFRLSAAAERTEMPAGTPFVLTLRLEGKGSLGAARPPDLASQPGFADQFSVHLDGERTRPDGAREFNYTLRPRSEAVKEVPAISLSYFDPKADRFEMARSQAIPLQVTPAAPLAAVPDAPAAEQPAETPVEEHAVPGQTFLSSALPWLGLNLAVLLAAVAAWLLARRWRQVTVRRVVRNERQMQMHAAHQRLHGPHLTVDDVRTALQDFLRGRLDLPPGEITPHDAQERIEREGLGSELAAAVAEVMRGCETAEFAPGLARPAAADLAAAADRVIRALLVAKLGRKQKEADPADELTREREAALAE
jgi:hypothetical protein